MNTDVVLALMPFGYLTHPSPAMGCLAGGLAGAGIQVRSMYFSMGFAAAIGMGDYYRLCFSSAYGEWTFSRAAFPDMARDDGDFFQKFKAPLPEETLLRIRDATELFLEECAEKVLALKPRIVGCSSSHSQNCASLALLRRIREKDPAVATVMGGANCEGDMGAEMHSSFPWVDYVFSGEADESFPDFCLAHLAGEEIGGADGWWRDHVLTPADRKPGGGREHGGGCESGGDREPGGERRKLGRGRGRLGRGRVADLSTLPLPIFDDYFETLAENPIRDQIIPGLVLETSRGCWWGAKKPCAFCGLNGLAGKQRVKSPERAHREIVAMTSRHGISAVMVSDNIIPPVHIEELYSRFVGSGLTFMCEVPATLTRAQVEKLATAGVRHMQPGIEQLHDKSLETLGKPNRLYQNIRLLKWGREYGVVMAWNLLYAFPGEDDAWHGEAAALIPLLVHLQAPTGATTIGYHRFSPYFNESEKHGLSLKPQGHYRHIYPLDKDAAMRFAYFFEDENGGPPAGPGREALLAAVDEWKRLFPPLFKKERLTEPILAMTVGKGGGISIEDTRPCAAAPHFSYDGIEAAAYLAADAGKTAAEIVATLADQGLGVDGLADQGLEADELADQGLEADELADILEGFVAEKLMLNLGGRYLSLACRAPCRDYPSPEDNPGGWFRT